LVDCESRRKAAKVCDQIWKDLKIFLHINKYDTLVITTNVGEHDKDIKHRDSAIDKTSDRVYTIGIVNFDTRFITINYNLIGSITS